MSLSRTTLRRRALTLPFFHWIFVLSSSLCWTSVCAWTLYPQYFTAGRAITTATIPTRRRMATAKSLVQCNARESQNDYTSNNNTNISVSGEKFTILPKVDIFTATVQAAPPAAPLTTGATEITSRHNTKEEHTRNNITASADNQDTHESSTGAGSFGDIMSSEKEVPLTSQSRETRGKKLHSRSSSSIRTTSPTKSGLVTADGGTLQASFGITSPLDRMALTANGNLQRLFSSYYDAPVRVVVDKCIHRTNSSVCNNSDRNNTSFTHDDTSSSSSWDRVVHLMVHNQTFCTATSLIIVHDEDCLSMVNNGEVGLGQIFRYLDKLPTFELLQAGRTKDGGLWRLYDLSCKEVSCRIREEFVPHAWDVNPG